MEWTWDLKTIRKNAWDVTFHRGLRAWFMLVVVGFLFAFIGASNASQVTFVDVIDQAMEASNVMVPNNTDVIDHYLDQIPILQDATIRDSDLVQGYVNSVSKSTTWIVRLLAINPRYVKDNPDEVMFDEIVVAIIAIIIHFFVQNVVVIGQYRYAMECRFSRDVPWRRTLAPFHLHTLPNVIWVMVCYRVCLLLWSLTIVGLFYKLYQYMMVPYLLAENPHITWREARRLSMDMTKGYKWKMFLAQMSYLYILLLQLIPIVGLLVAVPLESELGAEFYFTLRANPQIESELLVERAFDAPACTTLPVEEQLELHPQYLLKNLDIDRPHVHVGILPYPIVDLIYIFFAFCFVGWVWECGLHYLQMHEWVNRGTMYGPWIPIYGVGGAGIVALLDRYKGSPVRLFGLTVVLCAILEYTCSWILDFMFNSSYWDYKDMLFNVNGRICLAGLLAFGFGGLFGVYIAAPLISRFVEKMPPRARYTGAAVLVAAFCSDLIYCMMHGFNTGSGVGEKL